MKANEFNDKVADLAAACRYDPLKWILAAFDWGHGSLKDKAIRAWQKDIAVTIGRHLQDKSTRYQPLLLGVSSGHGVGKSSLLGMLTNWVMSCHINPKSVITANSERQLMTKTAPEIHKWFNLSLTKEWFDLQTMSISLKDNEAKRAWRTDFIPWSIANTEGFAGLHNEGRIIFVVFDEGSGIDDKIWEVTEGALTDEKTIIIWLVFGNPTQATGRFRECFRKYKHRWITRQIDSRTVEGTNKEQLNKWVADYGEDSDFVKVRVRGIFPNTSANQFISQALVDKSLAVDLKPYQYTFAPVIIGVDPAWTGNDELTMYMRQGLYSKLLYTCPKNDDDVAIARRIAYYEDTYQASGVFIDAGYGTGIYSIGKSLGRNWRLVWFNGEVIDKGYLNKRAEMAGGLKQWLVDGGALDKDDKIIVDEILALEAFNRQTDGRIQLASKDDMRDMLGASPNRLDALGLTFAFPVSVRDFDEQFNHDTHTEHSWDNPTGY